MIMIRIIIIVNIILDPFDIAVKEFDSLPSISRIKERTAFCDRFEFREVTVGGVGVHTRKLNLNSASPINSIPAEILMENSYTVVQSFKLVQLRTI